MIPNLQRVLQTDVARLNKASMTWLIGRVTHLYKYKTLPGAIAQRSYINNRKFNIGDMFIYYYDAKLKAELPYWDRFPLCVIIERYENGWLGLNLHYLPPKIRMVFLNKIILLASLDSANHRIRMRRISYDLLKNAKRFNAYVPCLKRYLVGHVRSQMLRIMPHEWQLIAMLPTAKWQKKTGNYVYTQSRKMIR